MNDLVTEQEHLYRRRLGQIGHVVTVCPECGVNNFWTKYQEIKGVTYYWQQCSSCGHKES